MISRAMLTRVVIQEYKESCKNIEYNSRFIGTLSANCEDGKGGFPYTQLAHIDNCNGDIQNNGGSFQCIQQGSR